METLRLVPNTIELEDALAEGATTVHLLGTVTVPEVRTNRAWLTAAKTAWFIERDNEQARRKVLKLVLANKLNDMLGVDVGDRELLTPAVEVDGYVFTVRERGTQRGPEYVLCVSVPCAFCERTTEVEFASKAELGEVLCEPKGNCSTCGRAVGASGTSAS